LDSSRCFGYLDARRSLNLLKKSLQKFKGKKHSTRNESISELKSHLDSIKKELSDTQKQITLLEKSNISEWEKIDFVDRKSVNDLRFCEKKLSKEINQSQKLIKAKSKTLLITEISLLPVVFLLLIISGVGPDLMNSVIEEQGTFQSKYFIENLRGDTLDTWKSWRLFGTTMNVNIIAPNNISSEKVSIVTNAISSMEAQEIDDSLTHKGPKGSSSMYYFGWQGALNDLASKVEQTKYKLPLEFNIIKSSDREGDIVITLSNIRDTDGYTGYTKSVVEGNEILKSFITIYDVSNLSSEQLATITRHEFGHALGLGHSTAPEDLMAPTIDMTTPYISECNVAGLVDLYNGGEGSKTVCEK
jgi:hypothetical protein